MLWRQLDGVVLVRTVADPEVVELFGTGVLLWVALVEPVTAGELAVETWQRWSARRWKSWPTTCTPRSPIWCAGVSWGTLGRVMGSWGALAPAVAAYGLDGATFDLPACPLNRRFGHTCWLVSGSSASPACWSERSSMGR